MPRPNKKCDKIARRIIPPTPAAVAKKTKPQKNVDEIIARNYAVNEYWYSI